MNEKSFDQKLFGKRIRIARENLDMTQAELSEKVGISQNFLGDIERGLKLPSLNKLIYISNFLNLSLDSMFADSLDNFLYEPNETYYTDKQLNIIKNVIKNIKDNF